MSLLNLPPELIYAILDNIREDRKLLCAVAHTCHALHDHVSPLLYSSVRIRDYVHLLSFAKTMLNNPNLARLVNSFIGPLLPSRFAFQPVQGWLQNIVNLKSLHVMIANHASESPFPQVSFRLTSFEVSCYYGLAPIESFLESQQDLVFFSPNAFRYLERRPLSPQACQKLKVLRGNIYAARAILPGRRVARFEWIYPQDEPVQVVAGLLSDISEQLNNLRSLSYRAAGASTGIHSLYALPSYLQNLRFLEIQTMHPDDWSSISTLPNLRVLLVLEPSYVLMSVLDKPQRVIDLFSKCESLQRVDVGGRYYRNTLTCSRWLRGVEKPIVVSLHVAEHGRMEFLDDLE
ncbi:hypothetical protein GALMADRAFT_140987 [Galerina marginata CBS 339.88]|uniref:F-box domain-containing protein n=1 Tax=Galerina marginata (strain CBS 339.88) TaxID=685588 RepID=A0A067SX30_GALM3|nr:hypothetical protein GALMADRAFT_140987 [Galerina marginata CBS 339.88]